MRRKPLLDALIRSNLHGVLAERAIGYAISAVAFPGRFLPGEDRETQNQVVTFGICGLMTMMLQWHMGGYRESVQDIASVAARLLTQPLFPAAGKLL